MWIFWRPYLALASRPPAAQTQKKPFFVPFVSFVVNRPSSPSRVPTDVGKVPYEARMGSDGAGRCRAEFTTKAAKARRRAGEGFGSNLMLAIGEGDA